MAHRDHSMAVLPSQQLPVVAESARDFGLHYLFALKLFEELQVDCPQLIENVLVLDRTFPRRSLLRLLPSPSLILQVPPVLLSLLIATSVC